MIIYTGKVEDFTVQVKMPCLIVKRSVCEIVIVILAVMWKARRVGVPKALVHLPLLWLPVGKTDFSKREEILRYVDRDVDRLFGRKIWRFLLFRKRRCLAKGLLLAWYAKKLGMRIVLHFGVRIKQERLKSHCWVSYPEAKRLKQDASGKGYYNEIWKYEVS